MATQIILWEYQQQLRSDPYSRHGNGHADANQYFSVISGRPAEKAYNWILVKVYLFPFLVTETPLPFKVSRLIFRLLVSVIKM